MKIEQIERLLEFRKIIGNCIIYHINCDTNYNRISGTLRFSPVMVIQIGYGLPGKPINTYCLDLSLNPENSNQNKWILNFLRMWFIISNGRYVEEFKLRGY